MAPTNGNNKFVQHKIITKKRLNSSTGNTGKIIIQINNKKKIYLIINEEKHMLQNKFIVLQNKINEDKHMQSVESVSTQEVASCPTLLPPKYTRSSSWHISKKRITSIATAI